MRQRRIFFGKSAIGCRLDREVFDELMKCSDQLSVLAEGVKTMMRHMLAGGLLVAGLVFSLSGDDKHDHDAKAPTNTGFEKLKKLVGTWVMADEDGKPTDKVVSVIKLTAGG